MIAEREGGMLGNVEQPGNIDRNMRADMRGIDFIQRLADGNAGIIHHQIKPAKTCHPVP